MADDIEKQEEEVEEEVDTEDVDTSTEESESESSSQEETVDYSILYEAEKERADAAEALIVKNKAISKRQEGKEDASGLTEDRVLELIKQATSQKDDSDEAKRLSEAQAKVKALTAKKTELARALKNRDSAYSDTATSHQDSEKAKEPKLPEGSPLKSYKYAGNGVYTKKLANGKTMFVNTRAMANERKKWVQ